MRSKARIGLTVLSVSAVLATGAIVTAAVAERSAEPAKPEAQTIRLGSLDAPAKRARTKGKTLRTRRSHTSPFSAYGVSWASGAGAVEIAGRVRQDGRWTPWQELDVDGPGGPDQSSDARAGASLVWAGPSEGIEVAVTSVSGPRPRQVRLDLINPGTAPADAQADEVATAEAPSAESAQPTIYRRADWGADESKMTWDPEYADELLAVVLHHTATSNNYQAGDVPGIIRSIYHYQAVTLGWGDIGYNVLVDRFGRLWEGRYGGLDRPLIGGHAGGFNTGTTGIAMIGHHSETTVPKGVIDSVAQYAAWRFTPDRIDPRGTTTITGGPSSKYPERVTITVDRIFPHRRTSNTECPGEKGMAALKPIRNQAFVHSRSGGNPRGPWPSESQTYTPGPTKSWS